MKNQLEKKIIIITSPIVELIVAAYLSEKKIKKDEIVILTTRNYKCSILEDALAIPEAGIFSKIFYRLFSLSLYSILIYIYFRFKKYNFKLYMAWDFPDFYPLTFMHKCKGLYYIEEGQMSHDKYPLHDGTRNWSGEKKRIKRWRNSHVKDVNSDRSSFKEFFTSEASGAIGLYSNIFPEDKKWNVEVVEITEEAVKNYKPKLNGIRIIGLMPAPRRINDLEIESVLAKLCSKLPAGSAIKLHPDFQRKAFLMDRVREYIKHFDIALCDENTILEIEMFLEKKTIYGPLSSLKRYTSLFGSDFIDVELY